MRHKTSVALISIVLAVTSIFAGEPHAYLIALANEVTLPKEMGIRLDLVPDLLSYSFSHKVVRNRLIASERLSIGSKRSHRSL
jgi:hypothetical protein